MLDEVSIDVTCGQISAATARRTEAIESEADVSGKEPGIHVEWRGVSAKGLWGVSEVG